MFHNKNEILNALKVFKTEVEKQCEKQIKLMRFDRDKNTMIDTLRIDKHLVYLED